MALFATFKIFDESRFTTKLVNIVTSNIFNLQGVVGSMINNFLNVVFISNFDDLFNYFINLNY